MGILKNEIMRTYNMRPSTAERCMEILEVIDSISKKEYERGFADGRKPQWISCTSEEKPKDRQVVIVTVDDGYQRYTDTDEYIDGKFLIYKDVVAWKPFDEPWRGEV